jgi:spore coat polysaccharide biosynthesis protein SpsF
MGSSRLSGKVLEDLAGHSVLFHVLKRCQMVPGIDVVCCATTEDKSCDAIAVTAEECGAAVYRGSEQDVLDRYYRAAREIGCEVVMRVTSDCPLIDPEICGRVLRLREDENADYACNNMPPSWPHGLDCEAFTFAALEAGHASAKDPYEREHVTPWLKQRSDLRRVNLAGPGGGAARNRWTLDYPEDLEFFRALFARLPDWPIVPTMNEVLGVIDRYPDIATINKDRAPSTRRHIA